MPKQRSTRTVADVKKFLQSQATGTDNRGQPDNTPILLAQSQDQPDKGPKGETEGATPTPTLKEAEKDADAPLAVEERGKVSTVQPQSASVPRRTTAKE